MSWQRQFNKGRYHHLSSNLTAKTHLGVHFLGTCIGSLVQRRDNMPGTSWGLLSCTRVTVLNVCCRSPSVGTLINCTRRGNTVAPGCGCNSLESDTVLPRNTIVCFTGQQEPDSWGSHLNRAASLTPKMTSSERASLKASAQYYGMKLKSNLGGAGKVSCPSYLSVTPLPICTVCLPSLVGRTVCLPSLVGRTIFLFSP